MGRRKVGPASTAIKANSWPAGSSDLSAGEGYGHILGADSALSFFIVVSTPIVAASISRQPTVSVTNVVTHNHICPLTPFNVEVTFMFIDWSAKKQPAEATLKGGRRRGTLVNSLYVISVIF